MNKQAAHQILINNNIKIIDGVIIVPSGPEVSKPLFEALTQLVYVDGQEWKWDVEGLNDLILEDQ